MLYMQTLSQFSYSLFPVKRRRKSFVVADALDITDIGQYSYQFNTKQNKPDGHDERSMGIEGLQYRIKKCWFDSF